MADNHIQQEKKAPQDAKLAPYNPNVPNQLVRHNAITGVERANWQQRYIQDQYNDAKSAPASAQK